MAVLRDDSQPVNFELPDGDVVSLVTWAYILKKLDTELNGTVASLFSINEYLKRINSRVDTWLEEQKDNRKYANDVERFTAYGATLDKIQEIEGGING